MLAFSGGLDSSVLLHRLAELAVPPRRLRAVHVHHGLQDGAEDWAQHCQARCAAVGVPSEVLRVRVLDEGQGPEAAARQARYAALRARLAPGEVLVTAHHRDDQAETLLLRLLRGSGVQGLAGMRSLSRFPPGWLWRPLLERSREELRVEAGTRGLDWIEDPHNRDPRYARSYLRSEILPRLLRRWPAATTQLARAAELQGEAAELLDERAAEDLGALRLTVAPARDALPVEGLRALSAPRRRNLLRYWIAGLGLPTPFHDSLLRVDTEVLGAVSSAAPHLAWPGAELRRYRDRLYAMAPLPSPPEGFCRPWSGRERLQLPPGCGGLRGAEGDAVRTIAAGYEVRLPPPGGRFRPAGSAHSRTLKNLFQERGIPPWVRLRTPVLERDGRICWIGGIGWAEGFEAVPIAWRDAPPGSDDG